LAPRKRKSGRASASGRPSAPRPSAPAPSGRGSTTTAGRRTVETPDLAAALGSATELPQLRFSVEPVARVAGPAAGSPGGGVKKPVTQNEFLARYAARAQIRDAEARAQLVPLAPGERPWPIQVSAAVCALLALANLVLWLAGGKIGHKHPSVFEVFAFVVLMGVCGAGMWVLWFQAVLAFMVLLGIVIIYLALFLVEASNVLGVIYPVAIILASGFMFWKLVRVLARLQMPERRSRAAQR
jgi:hypothetical protein